MQPGYEINNVLTMWSICCGPKGGELHVIAPEQKQSIDLCERTLNNLNLRLSETTWCQLLNTYLSHQREPCHFKIDVLSIGTLQQQANDTTVGLQHIPHKKQACLIFSTWQCLEPHLGALGLCGGISHWTVHKGQSEDSEKVVWSHEAVRFVSSHKGTGFGMHYTNIMTAYVVILPKMHASFFQSEVLSPQLRALSNDKDSSG